MSFRNSKVVIVGAGNVGSITAYSIINQGLCEDVCLIDKNHEAAVGQALDMRDSVYFMPRNANVHAGDYDECADADIVIVTAAAPMPKDSNDRLEMLKPSLNVVRDVVGSVMESGFNGGLYRCVEPRGHHELLHMAGLGPAAQPRNRFGHLSGSGAPVPRPL